MKRPLYGILAVCLLFGATFAGTELSATGTQAKPEAGTVIEALRKGGYVIYLRHAATNHSQTDAAEIDFDDCGTQRNLSPEGRRQAQAIGQVFRSREVSLDKVISSPYCRAVETGRLAFGAVETSDQLKFTIRANEADTEQRAEALRRMLATVPAEGSNTVVVAHTSNLREATGIWPKPEGVLVIFRPMPDRQFAHVATIKPDIWITFASSE
jgi:phosphohistidine phosphatase SixA